jgi:hypothetical protein
MAVTWSSFYPYVQPHLPGCPEIVIEAHLQEAAAEFLELSEIWRFDIDPDFTSKNTSDYPISVPTNSILENILFLYIDGTPMTRVSDKHFSPPKLANGSTVTGLPSYFSIVGDTTIRMYPTPAGKHTFSGLGVLKTKLTATGVENFIFETYGRAIAAGAIGRLAEIPGKEWSNPAIAAYYNAEFSNTAAKAKGRDTRRVNLRVSAVGFDSVHRGRG